MDLKSNHGAKKFIILILTYGYGSELTLDTLSEKRF